MVKDKFCQILPRSCCKPAWKIACRWSLLPVSVWQSATAHFLSGRAARAVCCAWRSARVGRRRCSARASSHYTHPGLSVATAQLHAKINKARTGGCECDRDWKSRLKCGDDGGGGKFLFHLPRYPSPVLSHRHFPWDRVGWVAAYSVISSLSLLGPLIGHQLSAARPLV